MDRPGTATRGGLTHARRIGAVRPLTPGLAAEAVELVRRYVAEHGEGPTLAELQSWGIPRAVMMVLCRERYVMVRPTERVHGVKRRYYVREVARHG